MAIFCLILIYKFIIIRFTQIRAMDKRLQEAQTTFQMLQCGSIDLNFSIEYGILLLGNTKAGKTTSSHYLCHQVLEGSKNTSHSTVYKLKAGHQRFENAKIGDKEHVSQTQIPNIFDVQLQGKRIHLIDCPGYLDSFGCYRIISNRFFHYQVFSKVSNMKFIITFPYNDMRGPAVMMIKAFRQFLRGFRNIQQVKQKLLEATSVLVTGVPKDEEIYKQGKQGQKDLQKKKEMMRQKVKQFFSTTPDNIGSELNEIFAQLKKRIVEKDRLYIFQVAVIGKPCDSNNKLLQKINQNSKFWSRDLIKQKQVDMSNINIQILDYVAQDSKKFNTQLKLLQQFYELNWKKQIAGLTQVILAFGEDVMKSEDSSQFIELMIKYNKQKKQWRDKNSSTKFLFQKYKSKRDNIKKQIFKPTNTGSASSIFSNQFPFWLSKFKSYKKLQSQISQIMLSQSNQRSSQDLEKQQKLIKNILQIFISLAKKRKEKTQFKQNQKNQIILDYAYEVYKDIVISNKLYHLVDIIPQQKKSQVSKNLEEGMFFILVQYPKQLKNVFMKSTKYNFRQMLLNLVQKYKFQQVMPPKASKQAAKFLEQARQLITQQAGSNNELVLNNLESKILALYNNAFQSAIVKSPSPNIDIIEEMQQLRLKLVDKVKMFTENAIDNKKLKMQNNKIIYLMAQCLLKNKKFKLSLELFDALFDAHKVFQVLEYEEQMIKKAQNIQIQFLDHLIKTTKYARKYSRFQLAVKKGQYALYLARDKFNTEKIYQISSLLKGICQSRSSQQNDQYLSNLFEEIILTNIKQATSKQLLKITTYNI